MHKGETLLLYKANGAPYFYGEHHSAAYDEWQKENSKYVTSFSGRGGMLGQRVYGDSDWFGDNGWIRASSTLTEGRTVYSTDKMGLKIGECWVEGARGQGINERLSLKPVQLSAPVIYISSGFVNFEKSYLYKENSRIKKIRVSNAFGNSIIIDLKDTPHFQPIDLTGLMPEDEIWWAEYSLFIDILDVYPGTKYTDTCVNSLYYPFSQ
jgi:hypothetical protein